MEFALQICGYLIGLPLEILVISALYRGLMKRYPFVFIYSVALFIATLVQLPVYVSFYMGDTQAFRSRGWVYWVNQGVLLPLLLLVVLSFIWEATSRVRSRHIVRLALIGSVSIAVATSFFVHSQSSAGAGRWMSLWTRDMNFISAVLDLGLWMLLASNVNRDRRVLMLSGGLGIQFTGEATGESLRNLAVGMFGNATPTAYAVAFAGNFLIMAANLVCLYVWRKAFLSPATEHKTAAVCTTGN